jgi:hypothetical protein
MVLKDSLADYAPEAQASPVRSGIEKLGGKALRGPLPKTERSAHLAATSDTIAEQLGNPHERRTLPMDQPLVVRNILEDPSVFLRPANPSWIVSGITHFQRRHG